MPPIRERLRAVAIFLLSLGIFCILSCRVPLTDAFGYDQHLGVLLVGTDGSAYLRFGRFGGPSAMPTLDVFAAEQPQLLPAPAFQTLRLVILLAILALLLLLRRKSIVTPIKLPPGRAIALTLQRLAGCAVDLVPLAVLAALILRIEPATLRDGHVHTPGVGQVVWIRPGAGQLGAAPLVCD